MGQYSSITRTGKHEPFGLHVKRGYVQGHEHVHKFGFNTSVTTSATLIWNGGGDYTYPTSAAQLGVFTKAPMTTPLKTAKKAFFQIGEKMRRERSNVKGAQIGLEVW